MNIEHLVGMIPFTMSSKLSSHFDIIHRKLLTYEHKYHQLKDVAFFLELALWKSKIEESRKQCRINCGVDVIIPNVLPYLIADE